MQPCQPTTHLPNYRQLPTRQDRDSVGAACQTILPCTTEETSETLLLYLCIEETQTEEPIQPAVQPVWFFNVPHDRLLPELGRRKTPTEPYYVNF